MLHTFCTSAESTLLPPMGLRMLRTEVDFWKARLKRPGGRQRCKQGGTNPEKSSREDAPCLRNLSSEVAAGG